MVLRLLSLLVGTLSILNCCLLPPRKVAVLIAAEQSEVGCTPNNAEFWNDTVLMYCMLRENGFTDDDIYVLYGDSEGGYLVNDTECAGKDLSYYRSPYCGKWAAKIPDYPMTMADPTPSTQAALAGPAQTGQSAATCAENDCYATGYPKTPACEGCRCPARQIFECLGKGCAHPAETFNCQDCNDKRIRRLRKCDYLFVWWKGHGLAGESPPESYRFELVEDVDPESISASMETIATPHRGVVAETCNSGCLASLRPDLFGVPGGPHPVILASSECTQTSWLRWRYDDQGHLHGPWSLWTSSALTGCLPPFAQNDSGHPANEFGLRLGDTLDQVFAKARTGTKSQGFDQAPTLKDCSGAAPQTRIDAGDPGGTVVARPNSCGKPPVPLP